MTTHLTIHTKAASAPNRFESFWTTGRKQGVIEVSIADQTTPDAAIVAELSALHFLLSHKEVCGADRAGNSMELNVTFGAIKKIAQGTSNKRHLMAHGRFLMTRFAESSISVSKSDSWISEARADNRREELIIDEPLPEVIQVNGVGKVGLSFHIIERMMERANYASIGAAWRHLRDMLGSSRVSEVQLPAAVVREKIAKHGSIGKHLRVPSEPWHFVVSHGGRFMESMPMLVTAYVRA